MRSFTEFLQNTHNMWASCGTRLIKKFNTYCFVFWRDSVKPFMYIQHYLCHLVHALLAYTSHTYFMYGNIFHKKTKNSRAEIDHWSITFTCIAIQITLPYSNLLRQILLTSTSISNPPNSEIQKRQNFYLAPLHSPI